MGSKKRKRTIGNPASRGPSVTTPRAGPAPAGDSVQTMPQPLVGGRPPRSARTRERVQNPTDALFELSVDESQVAPRGCAEGFVEDAEPQGVAATYAFHAPESSEPYAVAVRFVGARSGIEGEPGPRDRFDRTERVEGVVGHGQPIALTTRRQHLNPGTWRVVAEPVEQPVPPRDADPLPRRVLETRTRFGPLPQGPAVRLWVWPTLIALGTLLTLILQAVLAERAGLNFATVLLLSLVGSVLGFGGGRLWYLGLHRKPLREFMSAGACIQGFLLVSLAVLTLGSLAFGLPAGTVLDVTTPGLFLGIAVGRPGCFFTGCCAGRPTSSGWGLRSSDRRIVIRRFPVQLFEAASGLVIGLISLAAVLLLESPAPGAVFVGAVAAYTLVRQLLFPFRVESRTRRGRLVTMVVCGLILAGVVAAFLA